MLIVYRLCYRLIVMFMGRPIHSAIDTTILVRYALLELSITARQPLLSLSEEVEEFSTSDDITRSLTAYCIK